MFTGLSVDKLVLISILAAFLIGPERLPRYTAALRDWLSRARDYATDARERLRDEMGDEFSDLDWRALDPRRYDPRRIIAEALVGEDPSAQPSTLSRAAVGSPLRHRPLNAGEAAPFDPEAT